jgi:hypothetical protein
MVGHQFRRSLKLLTNGRSLLRLLSAVLADRECSDRAFPAGDRRGPDLTRLFGAVICNTGHDSFSSNRPLLCHK